MCQRYDFKVDNIYKAIDNNDKGSNTKMEGISEKNEEQLKNIKKIKFKVIHNINSLKLFTQKMESNSMKEAFEEKNKGNKFFIAKKKRRKEMNDNIRKKVKSNFFKSIKKKLEDRLQSGQGHEINFPTNSINCNLHSQQPNNFSINSNKFNLQSKHTVNEKIKISFGQKFIINVSKKEKENQSMWEQNLYTLLEKHLTINNTDILKLLKNDEVVAILLKDLYNEYLNSQEFEDSIPYDEKDATPSYIINYINKAKDLINYFTNNEKKEEKFPITLSSNITGNLFPPEIFTHSFPDISSTSGDDIIDIISESKDLFQGGVFIK